MKISSLIAYGGSGQEARLLIKQLSGDTDFGWQAQEKSLDAKSAECEG